jgi:proline dehydrogenase
VVYLKDDSFVERILYRLVKKHVSGTTMSSALEKTKELNSKNMHVSITFLSNSIATRQKAKYVTTTYLELVRQISRLGLKASIQAPLNQLGLDVDEQTAAENLSEIIKTGNKYGVFVWAEVPQGSSFSTNQFDGAKGFGIAAQSPEIGKIVKAHKGVRAFKAIFNSTEEDVKSDALARQVANLQEKANTVMLSPPDALVRKLMNGGKGKKSIIFEFRFGDRNKKLKRLAKKGARTSVYLPFGKDWQAYAMNNVPEGYMRFLAGKLLSETEEQSSA